MGPSHALDTYGKAWLTNVDILLLVLGGHYQVQHPTSLVRIRLNPVLFAKIQAGFNPCEEFLLKEGYLP